MKNGYAISVGVNAVLLSILVAQWTAMHAPVVNPRTGGVATPAFSRHNGSQPSRATGVGPVPFIDGWRNWIDPLRAAQVPTDVLAGLVQADFDHRWQTRQSALQAKYMRGEIDADGLAAAGLEHDAELRRELQAALGPGPFREWDMNRLLAGLNVDRMQLSDRERGAVYDLERNLRDELQQAQVERFKGRIDQATLNAQEQQAQEAANQRLSALLGEQRASGLQGADDTLGRLKRALNDLPLAPTQLDALTHAQEEWDRQRSNLVSLQVNTQNPALDDAIQANDEEWRRKFEQIAGPEAFDRYVSSQDSRYVDLQRFATQWGLKPGKIDDVFASIENFEDTVREFRSDASDRNVAPSEINATLEQFTQRTEQDLKAQLGDTTYARLESNGIKIALTP
ncbi:MAG TPA: hypothetical protein VGM64_05135 [Lacunisphaera sp.]|jgi:hypothetical protein